MHTYSLFSLFLQQKLTQHVKQLYSNDKIILYGFAGSSAGKECTCNAGDPSSIPGLGRSPGEGIGIYSSILGLPWWLRG